MLGFGYNRSMLIIGEAHYANGMLVLPAPLEWEEGQSLSSQRLTVYMFWYLPQAMWTQMFLCMWRRPFANIRRLWKPLRS